jgi:hypothetical protein
VKGERLRYSLGELCVHARSKVLHHHRMCFSFNAVEHHFSDRGILVPKDAALSEGLEDNHHYRRVYLRVTLKVAVHV